MGGMPPFSGMTYRFPVDTYSGAHLEEFVIRIVAAAARPPIPMCVASFRGPAATSHDQNAAGQSGMIHKWAR